MEFERLHNINNGLRVFSTATSTSSLFMWTEGGSTYISTMGCDPSQFAIKILADDKVEVNGLDDFVTISTDQEITGKKTFTNEVKFTGLSTFIPYPYYTGRILSISDTGEIREIGASTLPYVTLDTDQEITGAKNFTNGDFKLSGLSTTLTTSYTGNIVSIESNGRLYKLSASSLPYVTLNTTQEITGSKNFTNHLQVSGNGKYFAVTDGAKIVVHYLSLPSPPSLLNTKIVIWNQNDSTLGSWDSYSLPYVTLTTDQWVSGNKTFTAPSTTISGGLYLPSLSESYTPLYCLAMDYGSNKVYKHNITGYVTTSQNNTFTGNNSFTNYTNFTNSVYFTKTVMWGYNSSNVGKLWYDGDAEFPYAVSHTTTYPPNAYLDPVGYLKKSVSGSSTRRIKKDIEDVDPDYSKKLHTTRPIWYRHSIKTDTPEEWGWFGFIAEEMAEILPQMVIWEYPEEAYECLEKEKPCLKKGAVRKPVGIRYDRLTVLLTSEIQRQEKRIQALEKQVALLLENMVK